MPIARTLGAVFLAIVVVASQVKTFAIITNAVTNKRPREASLGIAGSYAARRTVLAGVLALGPAVEWADPASFGERF